MICSAIGQLLAAAATDVEAELRTVLGRDDDYRTAGKPACDCDDKTALEQLVADLAADAHACLAVIDSRNLGEELARIGELLATVVGQDLEQSNDSTFRIARRVAKDRVISAVDLDARHGHKTAAREFDGYKGHITEDPNSEIITNTAGNAGGSSVAEDLIEDLLDNHDNDETVNGDASPDELKAKVDGDAAYGTDEFQQRLGDEGSESGCRTKPPTAPKDRFAKDQFNIDLEADTVACPN
jgi:hypothetical protein